MLPALPRSLVMVYPTDQVCGIRDYAETVICELEKQNWIVTRISPPATPTHIRTIAEAAVKADLLHLQFEYGAWTTNGNCLLESLVRELRQPALCTLHEVYWGNPMDYPYEKIRSRIPGGRAFKQWLYRRRHPAFTFDRKASRATFYTNAVQVHNEHQREMLVRKGSDEARIHVIPHGIPENNPAPFRTSPDPIRFGTFGFLTPDVDYGSVLEALARLECPWEYHIGGGPRLAEHQSLGSRILELAQAKGLGNRVRVLGVLPESELDAYFHSLDIYLAPFRQKSSSGSLSRAISYGLPIVSPRIEMTEDVCRRVPCLHLYKTDGPENLGEAIANLTTNLEMRKNLSRQSREYARAYSFANEASRLGDLYRGLAS